MRSTTVLALLSISILSLNCESTTESSSDIIESRTLALNIGDTLEVITRFYQPADSLTGTERTFFRLDSTSATIDGKSGVVRFSPIGYIINKFRYLENGDIEYSGSRPKWIPVATSGKGTLTTSYIDSFSYAGVYDRHVYTITSQGLGDTVVVVSDKKYRAGLASVVRKAERILNDAVTATEVEEARVLFVYALGAGMTTFYFPNGKASHELVGVRRASK